MVIYLLYAAIFLISILGIIAIFFGVSFIANILFGYGVPNVTTNERIHKLLLNNLSMDNNDFFIDIGCGEGVVLDIVSKAFPTTHCIGYENGPSAYKKAVIYKENNGGNYELYSKDFFKQDIQQATVIYCYLMPHLMKKVWKKINQDCNPGTLLYSNAFPIPEIKPTTKFTVLSESGKVKTLYLYTV